MKTKTLLFGCGQNALQADHEEIVGGLVQTAGSVIRNRRTWSKCVCRRWKKCAGRPAGMFG